MPVVLAVLAAGVGRADAAAGRRPHHHRRNHHAAPPAPPAPVPPSNGQATLVATLDHPAIAAVPVGSALYVAEKTGKVVVLETGAVPATVLDISALVSNGYEQGLLGIAVSGNHLYVDYTDLAGDIHVVEYTLTGTTAGSPRQLLTQAHHTYANHYGGNLAVGPDGKLYIGLGDGGGEGDPLASGQNLGTWLGKILRIDPTPSAGTPYTVPTDNPFVSRAGALPEIWAYGLRNPWRFSFDSATGDLWIGDVGQAAWEEVDHAAVGVGGQNYGWNLREGDHPYNGGAEPADGVDPVFEYDHSGGNCGIIGGFVYRGTRIPGLVGQYLYGDLCTGAVSALSGASARPIGAVVPSLASFAQDGAGELYALSLNGGVYRIDPA